MIFRDLYIAVTVTSLLPFRFSIVSVRSVIIKLKKIIPVFCKSLKEKTFDKVCTEYLQRCLQSNRCTCAAGLDSSSSYGRNPRWV